MEDNRLLLKTLFMTGVRPACSESYAVMSNLDIRECIKWQYSRWCGQHLVGFRAIIVPASFPKKSASLSCSVPDGPFYYRPS